MQVRRDAGLAAPGTCAICAARARCGGSMSMRMTLRLTIAALAAAGFARADAHEYKVGDLTIGHPHAIETAATTKTGAGYLSITNAGTAPDRLVAIEADFPRVELHATETDAAGVARMRGIEALEIPPGATVALEPRGTHVMFMGLAAPLKAGEKIDATLVFERAGEIAVEFNVEPRTGAEADHEGMQH
jgi:copper(I)-binding protein